MTSFRHFEIPLRLFVGDDSLNSLEKELKRAGCTRAVVLCGRSMGRSAELEQVREACGDRFAGHVEGVRAHSPRAAVEEAAARLSELEADAIIAVGGGSAMVTARAVAIALAEGKPLDQLCTQKDEAGRMKSPRLDAPKMPIFALPTTPSTAVVKPGTAIFDEASGVRMVLFDPKTRPAVILLDTALLATAPSDLVRGAALNTLCSAMEGVASGSDDQIALASLIQAVRLCATGLTAREESAKGLTDLAMAAILCGRGTDNTGMGLATVISHAVAKSCGVDGGVAKAVALPHVLRFNVDHIGSGRDALAFALGCAPEDIIATSAQLFQEIGVPQSLRELGVPKNFLADIASRCMGDWFISTNPRPVEREEDVLDVLEKAW